MTDLDTALRAMLAERAEDITAVPPAIAALARTTEDQDHSEFRQRPDRRTAWLIAAAVAAVLAITGSIALIRHGSSDTSPHPARPNSTVRTAPTTPPTPTPPAPPQVRRTVDLSWFGMGSLPGYDLLYRENDPGKRFLALRATDDPDVPKDCNGCGAPPPTANVTMYDAGRFDPVGLTARRPTTVHGRIAQLGTTRSEQGTRLPTLAWQYAANAWVVVQGLTSRASTDDALHTIASAVQPTVLQPVRLPLRVGQLPANLSLAKVYGSLSGRETTSVTMDGPAGASVTISLDTQATYDGIVGPLGVPTRFGDLPGRFDPTGGIVAAKYATDRFVSVTLDDGSGTFGAAQKLALRRITDSIVFVPGAGVPAEDAIP